jgi:hypothetical protein
METGYKQFACEAVSNAVCAASYIQIVGGVNRPENFENSQPGGPNPLFTGADFVPDPLSELPVPNESNGVVLTNHGEVKLDQSSGPTTLEPGIYHDIQLTNGANVVFSPGIYVLSPRKPNQGLRMNGEVQVLADGVMFYVTGSNYLDAGAGYYDTLDGPVELDLSTEQLPPPPDPWFKHVRMATVDINVASAHVVLGGLQDEDSPFHQMLFFQRRRNENRLSIQGKSGDDVTLGGRLYAKWADFKLAGHGRYDAQFVVGSMSVSGGADVVLRSSGGNWGVARQVFLVE